MLKKSYLKMALFTVISFGLSSCDVIENLLLSDAETLMKEMGGTWKLKSVREETLFSSNGNFETGKNNTFDSTYVASGDLVINPSEDKKTYTGTINIQYANWNESVEINGNCTKANTIEVKEKLYIISEESIQALFMYAPAASTYIYANIIDRTKDGFKLVFSEFSYDYGYLKKRTYEYSEK